jgi:hypothetical protein
MERILHLHTLVKPQPIKPKVTMAPVSWQEPHLGILLSSGWWTPRDPLNSSGLETKKVTQVIQKITLVIVPSNLVSSTRLPLPLHFGTTLSNHWPSIITSMWSYNASPPGWLVP